MQYASDFEPKNAPLMELVAQLSKDLGVNQDACLELLLDYLETIQSCSSDTTPKPSMEEVQDYILTFYNKP